MRIDQHDGASAFTGGHGGGSGGGPPRQRRPWLQLISAVMRLAGREAELLRHSETPWASITFCGARHRIALSFTGAAGIAAGERLIAALPEHEFTLRGHLVAEALIAEVVHETLPQPRMTVEAELLLLDDG